MHSDGLSYPCSGPQFPHLVQEVTRRTRRTNPLSRFFSNRLLLCFTAYFCKWQEACKKWAVWPWTVRQERLATLTTAYWPTTPPVLLSPARLVFFWIHFCPSILILFLQRTDKMLSRWLWQAARKHSASKCLSPPEKPKGNWKGTKGTEKIWLRR